MKSCTILKMSRFSIEDVDFPACHDYRLDLPPAEQSLKFIVIGCNRYSLPDDSPCDLFIPQLEVTVPTFERDT